MAPYCLNRLTGLYDRRKRGCARKVTSISVRLKCSDSGPRPGRPTTGRNALVSRCASRLTRLASAPLIFDTWFR